MNLGAVRSVGSRGAVGPVFERFFPTKTDGRAEPTEQDLLNHVNPLHP